MAGNENLTKARKGRHDEFYTRYRDVEAELEHYWPYLKNKSVFCNCNDLGSSFYMYLSTNFERIGLRRLIATGYDPNGGVTEKWEIWRDEVTGRKLPAEKSALYGGGDFLSPECTELLRQCDVVVTNPPFSLFRPFVSQLAEYRKDFIIIGNLHAVTYKEMFPMVRDGRMRPGVSFNRTFEFAMPDHYRISGKTWFDGRSLHGFVPGICFWTSFDVRKQELLSLCKSYAEDPSAYPRYDNYDAVNVDRTADIPYDYDGVMGVPVSFLGKWCPSQFKIVGITCRQYSPQWCTRKYDKTEWEHAGDMNGSAIIMYDEKEKRYRMVYDRLLIRKRKE